jgi:hypothetical protein
MGIYEILCFGRGAGLRESPAKAPSGEGWCEGRLKLDPSGMGTRSFSPKWLIFFIIGSIETYVHPPPWTLVMGGSKASWKRG